MLSKKKQEKFIVSFCIKIKLILELAPSIDRFGCFSWNLPDHPFYDATKLESTRYKQTNIFVIAFVFF